MLRELSGRLLSSFFLTPVINAPVALAVPPIAPVANAFPTLLLLINIPMPKLAAPNVTALRIILLRLNLDDSILLNLFDLS